jgi:hypothetical protein
MRNQQQQQQQQQQQHIIKCYSSWNVIVMRINQNVCKTEINLINITDRETVGQPSKSHIFMLGTVAALARESAHPSRMKKSRTLE